MAAKFIILAFAVASAAASCQEEIFGCGETVSFQSAPRMEVFQSAPSVELVQSAPRMEVFQSAPRMELVQSAPSVELVQAAPAVEVAQVASTGPQVSSRNLPVVQAPSVTLNPIESPIIRLPSPPIPGPRVVRHQCFCTKTVVRPQVIQRTVTVPRIQRYLKQSYKPIVENLSYQARPMGNDACGEDIVISGSSSAAQTFSVPVTTQEVAIPVRTQEVAIPVRTQEVAIPVRTQQVAIPVRTQQVVRSSPVIYQEEDCQC